MTDLLEVLPSELLVHICHFVSSESILAVTLANKRLKWAMRDRLRYLRKHYVNTLKEVFINWVLIKYSLAHNPRHSVHRELTKRRWELPELSLPDERRKVGELIEDTELKLRAHGALLSLRIKREWCTENANFVCPTCSSTISQEDTTCFVCQTSRSSSPPTKNQIEKGVARGVHRLWMEYQKHQITKKTGRFSSPLPLEEGLEKGILVRFREPESLSESGGVVVLINSLGDPCISYHAWESRGLRQMNIVLDVVADLIAPFYAWDEQMTTASCGTEYHIPSLLLHLQQLYTQWGII